MCPEITFITERMPRTGSSGAESYNYYICQLLLKAGYQIKLIVTGDNFDTPCFINSTYENKELFKQTYFIRYKSIFGVTVSVSFKSYLRPIKKIISRLKNNNSDKKDLMIGRFITKQEAEACLKYIDPNSKFVIFDTIFRYHERFTTLDNPKILIAHDVFSERTKSFNEQGFKVLPAIEAEVEAKVWDEFDLHVAINEDENQLISENDKRSVCTIFPSYQSSLNSVLKLRKPKNKILYIGANAHHNIHGLRYFLAEIWPKIIHQQADAELLIIGTIAASFHSEKHSGVSFLGRVDDLCEVANECKFSINPVYMGSGVKIKILDYLSLNLPCLTTTVGIMGFIRQADMPLIEVADDEDYSKKIIDWLSDGDDLAIAINSIPNYVKLFGAENNSLRLAGCMLKALNNDN